MSEIVYLNGIFQPLDQAKVSVMDRGFLLGDGVYEVIPIYNRKLFRSTPHLKRLENSLNAIKLPLAMPFTEWEKIFEELITRNSYTENDLMIYLQVTRGITDKRSFHFSQTVTPTIFVRCTPIVTKSYETLAKGGAAITLPDMRWENCYIKAITLLPGVLATQLAKENDADEAILIRNGYALEGASSNLFIVKNDLIITPQLTHQILAGVTRELVLEMLQQQQIPYEERPIRVTELQEADEIWMTGSTREILPIIQLNGAPVGKGVTGSRWHEVAEHYFNYKSQLGITIPNE